MDVTNLWAAIVIGAAGSLAAAGLLRIAGGVGEFLPRRVETLSIGSSFQPFRARDTGDDYDAVLWIQLRNLGASPLFVVRAGFRNTNKLPVYVNARRSQAWRNTYEVKFGHHWQEMTTLIAPGAEAETYVPLSRSLAGTEVIQGKRGQLILNYVWNGRPGRHVARL